MSETVPYGDDSLDITEMPPGISRPTPFFHRKEIPATETERFRQDPSAYIGGFICLYTDKVEKPNYFRGLRPTKWDTFETTVQIYEPRSVVRAIAKFLKKTPSTIVHIEDNPSPVA